MAAGALSWGVEPGGVMKDYFREVRIASAGQAAGRTTQATSSFRYYGAAANDLSPPSESGRGSRTASTGWYGKFGKRVLDVTLVTVSLPITLPLIALCALALALQGNLPFYKQLRLGRDGRQFSILKMRTMVKDAEARLGDLLSKNSELQKEWTATQKLKHDPRITPLGRFLRLTSLDELPQIWNVLRGEMSLVGPRPMMPSQLSLHENSQAYFSVRPGLTGIWQVSCRNERGFRHRAETDAVYVENLSLWGDLKVIWRTIGVVARCTGY